MRKIWIALAALLLTAGAANAQSSVSTYCWNPVGSGQSQFLPCKTAASVIGVGTGTTGAVVATLAATSGKTNYLCGFDVSAIGGTATVGPITVAGLLGGSFTYHLASTASGNTLGRSFNQCIPASAANTAITVTTTANGSASGVAVNAYGYTQ